MGSIQQYEIFYTQTAIEDIEEKADYIAFQLHDMALAEKWYFRLRKLIQEGLSSFPLKYPLYDVAPWNSKEIRLFITRNDVILYSVDSTAHIVYIRGICTKGQDLAIHLEIQEQQNSQ